MFLLVAVQRPQVLLPQVAYLSGTQLQVAPLQALEQAGGQLLAQVAPARNLAERSSRGVVKHLLVDIEPNANDAVLNSGATQAVLNQDAAQFLVAVVQVVGPFQL